MENLFKKIHEQKIKRKEITPKTTHLDYLTKLEDEIFLYDKILYNRKKKTPVSELGLTQEEVIQLTKIITTCSSYLIHSGFDLKEILKGEISINENRLD